jgi:hypothetical protein
VAKLIYSAITSLDGYTADANGDFGWAAPDAEVHAFVNDLERPVGTYLYGRRMYDTMRYWETAHQLPDQSPEGLDFARVWQAADKIVYSTTLREPASARCRRWASAASGRAAAAGTTASRASASSPTRAAWSCAAPATWPTRSCPRTGRCSRRSWPACSRAERAPDPDRAAPISGNGPFRA